MRQLIQRLNLKYPVIQAPMAGGVVTPKMIAEVTRAGGLGSLPLGYLNLEEAEKAIHETKRVTNGKFSVNVFIPANKRLIQNNHHLEKMLLHINYYRNILSLPIMKGFSPLQEASPDSLVDLAVAEGVDIISFTFGSLSAQKISELQKKNIFVIGTATSVKEGVFLEEQGCNAVVAQGYEAGGHRGGGFLANDSGALIGSMSLIPQMVSRINVPIIASGGIMNGRGIVAALSLGASAVQMGTAFLACKESAASSLHKKIVMGSHDESSCITAAFTGKPVRSIKNAYVEETEQRFASDEIFPYPDQHQLTKDMRKVANQQNLLPYASFWSGQSGSLARSLSISDLMQSLDKEMKESVDSLVMFNQNQPR